MKPRLAALLFVLLFVVSAGVAWHACRGAELATTEQDALADKRRHLIASLQRAKQRRSRNETERTRLQARLAALDVHPPSAVSKPPLPPPFPDLQQILSAHPELQNLQWATRRAQLSITYGPLYRTLGLTPAQIDRFEQNILRREEQSTDLEASARHEGLANTDPTLRKLLDSSAQEYEAAQRALLGDSGAQQLNDYDRLSLYRDIVSGLAGAAAMAGTPLAAGQAEQLAQTLAAANPYQGTDLASPDTIDWSVVDAQAKSFLSSDQLTFIETTEPSGPVGRGGRFLPALHAAVTQAAAEDANDQSGSPGPTR